MALTDLTRISTSGIATGTSLSGAILHGDAHFRGTQVGVTSALFDSSDDALEFGDNVKLKFGNSGDLELYHSGSNSFIVDQGTGNLIVNTSAFQIKDQSDSTFALTAVPTSFVKLFYNNSVKLETTDHGAVVTGILTASSFSGPTNNTSGIATFYDLRVSNNLTVEGTTTTLDTNLIGVDRVEVGANSNTVTGIAVTQSGTADIVRLYDGSTQVVTVDDTGKVGLGSAIPSAKLDVVGTTTLGGQTTIAHTAASQLIIKDSDTSGTNSQQRISFRDSANTEMFFVGNDTTNSWLYLGSPSGQNNNVAFRINGNDRFQVNGNGAEVVGGSLYIPDSIIHVGDTDTKIRFPAADTFTVETAGDEALRIDSSGRLLLNTTTTYVSNQMMIVKGASPSAGGNRPYDGQLAIEGSETTGAINTGGVLAFIGHDGANSRGFGSIRNLKEDGTSGNYGTYMSFETRANGSAPAEKVRITSAGRVFIGESSVAGSARFVVGNGGAENFEFTSGMASSYEGGVLEYIHRGDGNTRPNLNFYVNNTGAHKFWTAGSERLVIGSTGTSTFDVGAPSSSNKVIGRFQAQSSRQLDIVWHDSGSLMGFNTPSNHSYIFKCNNSEKFRINNDGTSQFTGHQVKLYNSTDNSNTYFYAQNTGAGNAGMKMKNSSGEWTIIANDRLRFIDDDAGLERVCISSNGDVGIGTITPTNSSGYNTLSINGSTGGQIELSGSSKKHYIWANNDSMNIAAGYQGGSGYQLKVYTDGGGTTTERVRIEDGIVSILDDTAAYYKPELRIKNTSHSAYGGAITFTGEIANGTEYTQARIRTFGGNGVGDGTLAIEAGDLNEVARFKSGFMSIGGLVPNISGAKGLEISNAATTEIRLKNTSSGTGQSDGFGIQKWSNDTVYLFDYDQSDMILGVSAQSKLEIHKEGRVTLSPSGNTVGGNSQYALSIVQAGNYTYNGSNTSNYPGIHIKSTSSGGGNGVAIFAPDGNWSLVQSNPGNKVGLAMSPSSTGANSTQTRLFLMEDGQCILGANTFARVNQARYNAAQLTVAGGGINVVPITSGTSSPQVRHTVSWYHAGPNNSYTYQHLVTDVWGGANPTGNTEYIMGGFTIKGYRYSPGGCSNEDIFFHNWGGSMHGYSRSHRGTWDPGNAAYIHSTGYVALRLLTGTYQVYDIDLYQFAVYTARDFNVTTVTYSNNTTE